MSAWGSLVVLFGDGIGTYIIEFNCFVDGKWIFQFKFIHNTTVVSLDDLRGLLTLKSNLKWIFSYEQCFDLLFYPKFIWICKFYARKHFNSLITNVTNIYYDYNQARSQKNKQRGAKKNVFFLFLQIYCGTIKKNHYGSLSGFRYRLKNDD